tara:strand:- start:208 stop:921 length:714 start_codon:yes stop_codon:yes gene_type:complete
MGALEQITQLRNQGVSEDNIMKNLQDSGFSPREINEGFNQSQIKQAVSDESQGFSAEAPAPEIMPPQNQEDVYTPAPATLPEQGETYSSPEDFQEQGGQQDFYSSEGLDTGTIIEVSEQVFSEKIQEVQRKVEEITEFKTLTESKMENLLERIKRMEKLIDVLQVSILEKVGSYSGNLEGVKKEMSMMQDSFRKMVNPIARKHLEKHPKHIQKKIVKKAPVRKPIKAKVKKPIRKKR